VRRLAAHPELINNEKAERLLRIKYGLCSKCGKRKPRPGKRKCEHCYAVMKSYVDRSGRELAKEYLRQYGRRSREGRREKLIRMYGGCCACCGETYVPYLDIDHVDNDGMAHRAQYANYVAYVLAIMREHHAGLQVLCANCHAAKTRRYQCVHIQGARQGS
jgi:hypothetical protein